MSVFRTAKFVERKTTFEPEEEILRMQTPTTNRRKFASQVQKCDIGYQKILSSKGCTSNAVERGIRCTRNDLLDLEHFDSSKFLPSTKKLSTQSNLIGKTKFECRDSHSIQQICMI
jgi:hypothetical protein